MNIKLIPDERISGLFHINDYKLRKARNGYYWRWSSLFRQPPSFFKWFAPLILHP